MRGAADGQRAAGSWLAALCFLLAAPAAAQLRLVNLAEVQSGGLPVDEAVSQRSVYQQLNLAYTARGFEVSLRGETFGSSAAGSYD
ncbi:MAG: hypothetical protein FJY95_20230 [Candidatus Handelsmanbacteria bacterium]|nr:hypothetical protein [Candidatus Handelsmanbacteria bacterium]